MVKKLFTFALTGIMILGMSTTAFAQNSVADINADKRELELKEAARYTSTIDISEEQQRLFEQDINTAYQRVENEENYIVELINQQNNNEIVTNQTMWEYNLNFLKQNYQTLQIQSGINMYFVDSYIQAYDIVLLEKNMPLEKQNAVEMYGSYSKDDAVNYATTYYNNYNSNYPDWSTYGDCANFVSQCLYAGGKSMVGTPGTSASATDFANWFSSGKSANVNNVSSTWRGADAFKHYWKANAVGYKTFTSFTGAYDYGYRGDAVTLLNSNDRGFHTIIIVGYSNGDLVYAAHTGNTKTGSLKNQASSYDFIIYNM